MKKILAGFIVGLIILNTTSVFATTIDVVFGSMRVVLDGQRIDAQTMLYEGRTFIPLRVVSESFGHQVFFDEHAKAVFINTR